MDKKSEEYLNQYIKLTDKIKQKIESHANRYNIRTEICAWYSDWEDFCLDQCDGCGYTRTEARKLYHGGIGEFMNLPNGNGIIRFVIWKGRLSAMAEIKDCMNKKIKISKGSITIKDDDNKTCGVVRNIVSLYDLQANKQINYYRKIRDIGLHGKISIRDCIISDGTMYIFRNIKNKLFHEKYGYMDDNEKQKEEEQESIFNTIKSAGIEVIECIYLQHKSQKKELFF